MEKGSHGPAVNLILVFLLGWAYSSEGGVICDCQYGEIGTALMAKYQADHGLSPDGGCGPETRRQMLNIYGFNFQAAAESTGGTTIFVQPDGSQLEWTPEK